MENYIADSVNVSALDVFRRMLFNVDAKVIVLYYNKNNGMRVIY